jgi:hypothetical protein
VASGNTPVAADIAAIAGLGAQFDPARDPADDLATAKVEAQRGKKRILLEVGNAACERCRALDEWWKATATCVASAMPTTCG